MSNIGGASAPSAPPFLCLWQTLCCVKCAYVVPSEPTACFISLCLLYIAVTAAAQCWLWHYICVFGWLHFKTATHWCPTLSRWSHIQSLFNLCKSWYTKKQTPQLCTTVLVMYIPLHQERILYVHYWFAHAVKVPHQPSRTCACTSSIDSTSSIDRHER